MLRIFIVLLPRSVTTVNNENDQQDNQNDEKNNHEEDENFLIESQDCVVLSA